MRISERDWKDLTVRYRVLPAEPDAGLGGSIEILEIYGAPAPLTKEQIQALELAGVMAEIIETIEEEEL